MRDYWPANRNGLPDKAEEGDRFGRSLAAADFNTDGSTDLAIGVPSENQERTLAFDRDATGTFEHRDELVESQALLDEEMTTAWAEDSQ